MGNHNQEASKKGGRSWQQLVVRAVDGLGKPIDQYFLDFHYRKAGKWVSALWEGAPVSVHAYGAYPSLRCFHLDLERLQDMGSEWALTVQIQTGSRFVKASGWIEDGLKQLADATGAAAAIKLSDRRGVKFFFPNTTTLVEIRLDLETTEDDMQMRLVDFIDQRERKAERERRRQEEEQRAKKEEDEQLQAELTRRLRDLEERHATDKERSQK